MSKKQLIRNVRLHSMLRQDHLHCTHTRNRPRPQKAPYPVYVAATQKMHAQSNRIVSYRQICIHQFSQSASQQRNGTHVLKQTFQPARTGELGSPSSQHGHLVYATGKRCHLDLVVHNSEGRSGVGGPRRLVQVSPLYAPRAHSHFLRRSRGQLHPTGHTKAKTKRQGFRSSEACVRCTTVCTPRVVQRSSPVSNALLQVQVQGGAPRRDHMELFRLVWCPNRNYRVHFDSENVVPHFILRCAAFGTVRGEEEEPDVNLLMQMAFLRAGGKTGKSGEWGKAMRGPGSADYFALLCSGRMELASPTCRRSCAVCDVRCAVQPSESAPVIHHFLPYSTCSMNATRAKV